MEKLGTSWTLPVAPAFMSHPHDQCPTSFSSKYEFSDFFFFFVRKRFCLFLCNTCSRSILNYFIWLDVFVVEGFLISLHQEEMDVCWAYQPCAGLSFLLSIPCLHKGVAPVGSWHKPAHSFINRMPDYPRLWRRGWDCPANFKSRMGHMLISVKCWNWVMCEPEA